MELQFISENRGISKEKQTPYHMVKLGDPKTLENHTIAVDQDYVTQPFNIMRGTLVKVEGHFSTPYNRTNFLCTKLTPVQK